MHVNRKKKHGTTSFLRLNPVLPAMVVVFIIVLIIATAVGAVYVPFNETIKIILKNWGLLDSIAFESGHESIIYFVRFPRVLIAAVVGAALATSGTVMQGMFRNPMAEPGVVGVSSGAGLGAVAAIALGLTVKSLYIMPVFAIAGALIAAVVIFLLSSKGGKIPVLTLILSGIAVSTFFSAISSLILSFLNEHNVREYIFWTIGTLASRRWEHVKLAAIPIIICVIILNLFARDLTVLLLGDEEAQSVGLNPSRTRKILLPLVSITTAMAVCVSGTISFVGLIVPHIMRLIVGPDHRILIPASALGGAIFLVACDLIARIALIPREIGVGIVTSLLGAPYFLFLLIRARKEGAVF
jgi:iron complex transport system permease protein